MNAENNNHKAGRRSHQNKRKEHNAPDSPDFSSQIAIKTRRKLEARGKPTAIIWFGLGMMGVIGWSIVIPTLLGTALGIWLDEHFAADHSWTLALLIAGLILGCFHAWYWIDKEHRAMHDKQVHKEESDDE